MPERQPKPIPHPRKLGACAVALLDLLRECGVTHAQFFKTHHARVEFTFIGKPIVYHFPCTPRSDDVAAKRHRSKLAKIMGVRVG